MPFERHSRVVEKYYAIRELCYLLGFAEGYWRERAQAGDFTLVVDGVTIAEPVDLSGELRIPASGVNAWLARNPYRYDAGIKARNREELRRKLPAAAAKEDAK